MFHGEFFNFFHVNIEAIQVVYGCIIFCIQQGNVSRCYVCNSRGLNPESRLVGQCVLKHAWTNDWFSNFKVTWGFPKMGALPNHPFIDWFSHINHPFGGTPIYRILHMLPCFTHIRSFFLQRQYIGTSMDPPLLRKWSQSLHESGALVHVIFYGVTSGTMFQNQKLWHQ